MNILYFDTETTGFNPPAIVQLGFINVYPNGSKYEGNWVFNPGIPINPQAAKVHGITDKMVEDKGPFSKSLKEFVELTKKADYICGHNIDFDLKALFFEVDRMTWTKESKEKIDKWKEEVRSKSICTMLASVDLCKIPGRFGKYKWPKLSELHIFLFEEDFDGAHDAVADIKATQRCFLELKKRGLFPNLKEGKEKEGENSGVQENAKEDSKDLKKSENSTKKIENISKK